MAKDITIFLHHIAESANKIGMYLKDIAWDEFLSSYKIQDAVIRRLEIIGEAVKNMPDDFKTTYPNVPWRKIAGLRDVLYINISASTLNSHGKLLLRMFLS